MAKFCMYCGEPLPDEAVFCPNCGKKRLPNVIEADKDGVLRIPAPPGAVITVSDEPPAELLNRK